MVSLNTTSAVLEKIISDRASDHDFIPKKLWIGKCIQMVHAANVSKSSSIFKYDLLHVIISFYMYKRCFY